MPSAATWKDLEMITLNEVSQTEKDTMGYGFYAESLKQMIQMYLHTRQKENHSQRKHTYDY